MAALNSDVIIVGNASCCLCEDEGAQFKCLACDQLMCGECTSAHKRQKKTKSHEVIDLKEALTQSEPSSDDGGISNLRTCPKHSEQPLAWFCSLCHALVCEECVSESHVNHNDVCPSSDAFSRLQEQLDSCLRLIHGQSPDQVIGRCVSELQKCERDLKLHTDGLNGHFEQFYEICRSHVNEQVNKVKSYFEKRSSKVSQIKTYAETESDKYKTYFETINAIESKTVQEELLLLKNSKTCSEIIAFMTKWSKECQMPRAADMKCKTCTTDDFRKVVPMLASTYELTTEDNGTNDSRSINGPIELHDEAFVMETLKSLSLNNPCSTGDADNTSRKYSVDSAPQSPFLKHHSQYVSCNKASISVDAKPSNLDVGAECQGRVCHRRSVPKALLDAISSTYVMPLLQIRLDIKCPGNDIRWTTNESELVVYAGSEELAQKGFQILCSTVEQKAVKVRKESQNVMGTIKWSDLQGTLAAMFGNRAWASYSRATSEVLVCAVCSSMLGDAEGLISSFLQDNVIKTIVIDLTEPLATAVIKHTAVHKKITASMSQFGVTVNKQGQSIIVSGIGFGPTAVVKKIHTFVRRVSAKQGDDAERFDTDDEDDDNDATRFEDDVVSGNALNKHLRLRLTTGDSSTTVAALCLPGNDVTIYVTVGDITRLPASAVVNPADQKLKHNGGLAKALVQQGGETIQRECTEYVNSLPGNKLAPGQVFCSSAGHLPFAAIVHAVSCKYDPATGHDKVKEATTNTLKCVSDRRLSSIAIPAIGAGSFNAPIDVSTNAIVMAVKDFLNATPHGCLRDIYLCDMSPATCQGFVHGLCTHFDKTDMLLSSATCSSLPLNINPLNGQQRQQVTLTSQGAMTSLFLLPP